MTAGKLLLYYHTLKYLKPRQVFYQVYYRLRKPFRQNTSSLGHAQSFPLLFEASIPAAKSVSGTTFSFLNREKTFDGSIDWDFIEYGKLWCYNLNYFDFLHQEGIEHEHAVSLMQSFADHPHRQGLEPYPISLRGINWIKYFSQKKFTNPAFDSLLFSEYDLLYRFPEYHLMGNHLLENGFSLLFAAYYFRHDGFYEKASTILRQQLDEQILADGAHFELSPMYHQIILFRLLDCINLLSKNAWKDPALIQFLRAKAKVMVAWLRNVTFRNGDIPMVNDAAFGVAPSSKALFHYAQRMAIEPVAVALSASGYRMRRTDGYELFVDVAQIAPDYIPGHAHSDTFSFVLYVQGKPFIVDTGTSTYEKGLLRSLERSTAAHNTVSVNNSEQTQVWSAFRVGRRARILELIEDLTGIQAKHDGYCGIGVTHSRKWVWRPHGFTLMDDLEGSNCTGVFYLHFAPTVSLHVNANGVHADSVRIEFVGADKIHIDTYNLAIGFNRTMTSQVVKVNFTKRLAADFFLS
jgi:hypothetical protein